jgi:LuxR family maltose regulon positive regulatory protein
MTPLPVIEAKLARPRLPKILKRRRLTDRLLPGAPAPPVTLICAGAGYGKTTLLASLAESPVHDTLWYSLGEEDADLAVFLSHLAALLRRRGRRFGRALTATLEEGQIDPRNSAAAAGAFLNDLSRIRDPCCLVLDDFHLVAGNRELIRFLGVVLENNKSPVRIIIAYRTDPPLPLGRLRARRMILELGPADLAFTPDELRALLSEVYGREPSEEELDQVARFTEGWVTAVQLALEVDQRGSRGDLITALGRATRSGSALVDYLAEEVLRLQPEEDRLWMLRTSRFEELETQFLSEVLSDATVDDRLRSFSRRPPRPAVRRAGDDGLPLPHASARLPARPLPEPGARRGARRAAPDGGRRLREAGRSGGGRPAARPLSRSGAARLLPRETRARSARSGAVPGAPHLAVGPARRASRARSLAPTPPR